MSVTPARFRVPDGQIAPGRHRARCVAGLQPGGVLGEGGGPDAVQGSMCQWRPIGFAMWTAVACSAVRLVTA